MSNQRAKRPLKIRNRIDEEPMSIDKLHAAERLFAKLAVRMLLRNTSNPQSAGPHLHRCTGGTLTPWESALTTNESEQDDEQI